MRSGAGGVRRHSSEGVAEEGRGGGSGSGRQAGVGSGSGRRVGVGSVRGSPYNVVVTPEVIHPKMIVSMKYFDSRGCSDTRDTTLK